MSKPLLVVDSMNSRAQFKKKRKKRKKKKNHEISTFALPLLLFPKKKKNAIRTNSPASQ